MTDTSQKDRNFYNWKLLPGMFNISIINAPWDVNYLDFEFQISKADPA